MTKSLRNIAFVLVAVLLCVACLTSLAACKKKGENEVNVDNVANNNVVNERESGSDKYTYNTDLQAFLLAAVDDDAYTDEDGHVLGGGRAVAIFIAFVDTNARTIKMIQLDQNSMADMKTFNHYGLTEGNTHAQLALAYAYGDGGSESGQNLLNAVKSLTGLPLNDYVAIKKSAMPALSHLSGSVTMTLTADHTDYNSTYTTGSQVTLAPSEFESFLREHSAGFEANRRRMARMRDFVPAFFAALAPKGEQAADQVTALQSNMQFNFDAAGLAQKLQQFAGYTLDSNIPTPNGTSQLVGLSIEFTVDQSSLNTILINTCFKKEG